MHEKENKSSRFLRRPSIVAAIVGPQQMLRKESFRYGSRRYSNRSAASGGEADGVSVGGSSGLRRAKTTKREDRETLRNAVRHSAYNRVRDREPNFVLVFLIVNCPFPLKKIFSRQSYFSLKNRSVL